MERLGGAGLGGAEQLFQLGPGLLDRIQVRRIRRQEGKFSSRSRVTLFDPGHLVGQQKKTPKPRRKKPRKTSRTENRSVASSELHPNRKRGLRQERSEVRSQKSEVRHASLDRRD